MTRTRQLTGRHVLLIFLAFFITVTGVNALMVTFAVRSFSGEDVSSAYVKGLNYNQTLAQRDAEARSGYAIAAEAVRGADGATAIDAVVTHNGEHAGSGMKVVATMRHPANAHFDRTVTLEPQGEGRFAASVPDLMAGQWDLVVTVQQGDDTLYEARTRQWLR